MKRKLILVALLAVAACDNKTSTTTTTAGEAPGPREAASFDRRFLDMMVPHHEGAVRMAELAIERADHPELREAARQIVLAQRREIADMKGMRKQWFGSDETPAMDQMPMLPGMEGHPHMSMSAMMSQLQAATPFDKAFLDMMIDHHQMAVHAGQLEGQRGSHAELKSLGAKIADDQKKEIAQMERWRAEWFPAK